MRPAIKLIMSLSAAALAAADLCAQTEPVKVPASFSATFEDGPDKAFSHRVGEWVAVFDDVHPEPNVFRITSVSGRTYTLKGTMPEGVKPLRAICPYADTDAIPRVQSIPTGKPIDPAAFVSTADYDGRGFAFRNAAAFVKFEITSDRVTGIDIRGIARISPAGRYFEKGVCYAALPPGTVNGIKLICKSEGPTRWLNDPSRKFSAKRNAATDLKTVDTGNILLGRWSFTAADKATFSSFAGKSKKEGNGGRTLASNAGGNAVIEFCQEDTRTRSGQYAKRKINSKHHPEANYIWKGDYWSFRVPDADLPSGTQIHIKYTTRVSGRGMKYWRLEAWDGKAWINPEGSYGKAVEADGERYSLVNTPDGEKVECTWTLAADCKEVGFRMICASNWSYRAGEDGPGIITEPISASCEITDSEPYIEAVSRKR